MQKNVFVLFLLTVLFTACSTTQTDDQPTTIDSDTSEDQPSATEQIEANLDDAIDQEYFDKAVSLLDASLCEKILKEEVKDLCEANVKYSTISEEAYTKMDESICEQIDDDRFRQLCIDEIIAIKEIKEKDVALRNKTEEMQIRSLEENNPQLCKEIENVGLVAQCITNYIGSTNTTDATLCDVLKDEIYYPECLSIIEFNKDMQTQE